MSSSSQGSSPALDVEKTIFSERQLPARSPAVQQGRTSPAGHASHEKADREQKFKELKATLESSLRRQDLGSVVECYKSLGQHFMSGTTAAEHQAAKMMFEKAIEHASKLKAQAAQGPPTDERKPQKDTAAVSGRAASPPPPRTPAAAS
eukprot:CAMPEP_0172177480 /NCGR_PEP_ID=MMETSP1050-20130122/15459_1 /TAXON_ID=233186 /ORGANISM="Cryptomonas curvata, Strain CCAP979/52" /LENGTH=148 /DNA_ID=CAMNT_0012850003 /DNA_START=396 /DNA_END=839 /DNA_ORIENTATION=-